MCAQFAHVPNTIWLLCINRTLAFVYCKHKFKAAQLVAISFTKNRSITKLTPDGSQFDSRWRQFFVIS